MNCKRKTSIGGRRVWMLGVYAVCSLLLAACGGGDNNAAAPDAVPLSAAAQLGRQIFFDRTFSASGELACGTCHDPAFAFTANDGRSVPLGGPHMELSGFRNAPTLMYVSFTPAFHFEADGTPVGGFFRDGRSPSLTDQAQRPFVTSFEMAMPDAQAVIEVLKTRPYVADFTKLYGANVLDDVDTAMARIGAALAAFQTEDPRFHPFSSKYDAWLAGRAQLSAQEQSGLALYNSPAKGNCASCHLNAPNADGTPPMFTDFTYDNFGLPRNPNIPANDDNNTLDYVPHNGDDGVHVYYDLGLCGPLRTPVANRPDLCGAFKVPTLRDVALTAPYFHNGQFPTLRDALGFYVRRDTHPDQFFPANAQGQIIKFDDLPASYGGQYLINIGLPGSDTGYRGNVNTSEAPYNRHLGAVAALSPDEIDDVVAYLCTLTDGYDAAHPEAYVYPAQCPQAAR